MPRGMDFVHTDAHGQGCDCVRCGVLGTSHRGYVELTDPSRALVLPGIGQRRRY